MQKDKLNQIYWLYQKWELEEASVLVNQILESDPDNIYAKKYRDLINSKSKKTKKKEIIKVKWKQLKCPACLSKIWFSALKENTRKAIKDWEYNNKEIKCPYCHKKFVLQKRKARSIVWIKIWDTANIDNKKYRATWYIKYEGTWKKWSYSWKLYYLEWILVWTDNSYKYFSEWYFIDEWIKEEEFEISEKFIPKWKINTKSYKEINNLKVKSIYWENSKSFSIGEKVEILDFWDYVIEKEWAWRQAEAWFYKWKTISKKDAFNIFWKRWSTKSTKSSKNKLDTNIIINIVVLWFIFIVIIPEILYIFIPALIIYFTIIYRENLEKLGKIQKAMISIFIWIILSISSYSIFSSMDLWKKVLINYKEAIVWENYQINFKQEDLWKASISSSKSYDYGWVKKTYKQNTWVKFSLKDEKDLETLNEIKEVNNYKIIDFLSRMKNWEVYKIE